MAILPLATGENTTTGAGGAISIATLALPNLYFGMLKFVLSGEKAGDPTQTFSWECEALYSCDAGVATMRSQGAPVILDPDGYAWTVTLDQTGSSARITVTGIAGQNWVWAARISNSGRTRLPTGTTSYVDAAVHASVTADFVYTGADVVTDGGMEALGLPAWPAGGGATVTREDAGFHGGAHWMKVLGAAGAYASQACLVVNARYDIDGWMHGDGGTGAPRAAAGTNILSSGGVGAGWVEVLKPNFLCTGNTNLGLSQYSGGAGTYAGFDDWSAIRLPIASAVADQIIGGPGVAQATVAARPVYIDAGDYFLFDGTSQYFTTSFIPTGDFTVGGWFYVDSIAAGVCYFVGNYNAAGPTYCGFRRDTAVLKAFCGAGGSLLTHGTALTVGWHHIMFGRSGTTLKLWLDGVSVSNAFATDPAALPFYVEAVNSSGVAGVWNSGRVGAFLTATRLFSDAEVLDHYNATYRT